MVCVYCGHETAVLNSRLQKQSGNVWRRRSCTACGALFTTHEAPDLAACLVVQYDPKAKKQRPFERDRLFLSVVKALGHRRDAVEAASALTDTITASLLKMRLGALVPVSSIIEVSHTTLQRYDIAAAVQYAAYHPISSS